MTAIATHMLVVVTAILMVTLRLWREVGRQTEFRTFAERHSPHRPRQGTSDEIEVRWLNTIVVSRTETVRMASSGGYGSSSIERAKDARKALRSSGKVSGNAGWRQSSFSFLWYELWYEQYNLLILFIYS